MLECNFSYSHYEETLKEIKKNNTFTDFTDTSSKGIILRHDIDYSLEAALKIAEIEHNLDVKSTYFILFHAETYNPFSPSSTNIINKILKFGHRLGFHYDMAYLLQLKSNPSDIIKQELQVLENHFNTSIEVVSAHNPSVNESLMIKLPSTVVDAYSEEFTKKRKYLSDSVQSWREGCFCGYLKNHEGMQILTHPIWWTEDNKNINEIKKILLGGELDSHKKQIDNNFSLYKDYFQNMNKTCSD